MLELNKIYNMGCMKMLPQIPDNFVDCIWTDIPYLCSQGGASESSKFGSKNKNFYDPEKLELYKKGKLFKHNDIAPSVYMGELYRVLKEKGHIYLMTNSLHLSDVEIEMRKVGFIINNILVMRKNTCVTNQWYMKDCEFTIFARKGNAKPLNNCSLKTVMDVIMPNQREKIQEAQKPVDYIYTLIENSTELGDIVLDPFMGSGSTAIACIKAKRNYIGFEIDTDNYDLATDRINTVQAQSTIFDLLPSQ